MKAFITKYQVLIVSLLMAILMVVQQALTNDALNWIAIGYAALIAVLGVIANAWKGKGFTILGMIGTAAYAFIDIWNGGHFTWKQFILSALLAIITAAIKSLQPPTTTQP